MMDDQPHLCLAVAQRLLGALKIGDVLNRADGTNQFARVRDVGFGDLANETRLAIRPDCLYPRYAVPTSRAGYSGSPKIRGVCHYRYQ